MMKSFNYCNMDHQNYRRAKKRVQAKKDLFQRIFSFCTTIAILTLINVYFTPGHYWVLYVAFFWGIGLMYETFGFIRQHSIDERWEEREIEKEMKRMKAEDDYLELKEIKKQAPPEKPSTWKDSDLV